MSLNIWKLRVQKGISLVLVGVSGERMWTHYGVEVLNSERFMEEGFVLGRQ